MTSYSSGCSSVGGSPPRWRYGTARGWVGSSSWTRSGSREDRDLVDVFAIPRGELDARNYADPAAGPGDLTLASVEDTEHIARNEEALALYGWEPYLHNPRLRRWLPRIHVPTLVAWGAHDGIVSPGYGRAYADAIPGARFEIVDGAGHRAQVEQPATLAALVADHTV